MVAKGLELNGYTPAFLVSASSQLAPRYLRAFGIRRFVRIADYLDESVEEEARREAGPCSAARRPPASWRGSRSGAPRSAATSVSTVSRSLHEGTVDFSEPRARAMLDEVLLVAIRSTLAAEAILDDLQA